jgi:hypothetical protein
LRRFGHEVISVTQNEAAKVALSSYRDVDLFIVASLDRKCLRQKAFREFGTSLRGIFDKETRRKPLLFAADAGLWGLNRLSPVIDRIYDSCRNGAKVKKANENENVRLRHDSRSLAREASAAPAA